MHDVLPHLRAPRADGDGLQGTKEASKRQVRTSAEERRQGCQSHFVGLQEDQEACDER